MNATSSPSRTRAWEGVAQFAYVSSAVRAADSFAAWSIAAGVQLFYLSRIMGTSVTQIDKTYGHLVPDSEECLRGLLDSYDNVVKTAVGRAQ